MTELRTHLTSRMFNDILSIGYEFETNNLTKLSLSTKGTKYYSDITSARHLGLNEEVLQMEDKKKSDVVKDDFVETICAQEDKDDIQFCFFSDIGKHRQSSILSLCNKRAGRKDNWWKIRQGDKERKIISTTERPCEFFPNLEWNITFYQPRKFQHKVFDSFKTSVDLIIKQLVSMSREEVELELSKRYIKTWLLGNTFLKTGPNPFLVKPQLTFTCKIEHCIGIVRAFLFKGVKSVLFDIFSFLKTCSLNKKQKGYLFLVMAMAKAYADKTEKDQYFKSLMSFLPRHTIVELIYCIDREAISKMRQELPKYADDVLKSHEEQRKLDAINNRSTLFPLKDDIVFIEVRSFAGIVGHFLKVPATMDLLYLKDVLNPGQNNEIGSLRDLVSRRKTQRKKSTSPRSRKRPSSK